MTTLEVECRSCGAVVRAVMTEDFTTLAVGGRIIFESPCPRCGARMDNGLWAPAGLYERDASGVLQRIGDFTRIH